MRVLVWGAVGLLVLLVIAAVAPRLQPNSGDQPLTAPLPAPPAEASATSQAITRVMLPAGEAELLRPFSAYNQNAVLGRDATQVLGLRSPDDLATDRAGNLYVTDAAAHRVLKLDARGRLLAEWGGEGAGNGRFQMPRGIAVAPNGDVFVGDAARVQRFSAGGEFVLGWGRRGSGPGEFRSAVGIAVDSDGIVYVADQGNARVQVFDARGTFLRSWGEPGRGPGEFRTMGGLAVGTGGVYVVDTGNERVQRFDREGRPLDSWGETGIAAGQFQTPSRIALDDVGNVYVSDLDNARVQRFSATGEFLGRVGPGPLAAPRGVAVGADGAVFVADSGNRVIRIFRPS